MFYNGISGWPAHVQVGYATSEDGLNWTRMSDEPVFTGEGIDYTGVSIFVSSAIVLEDGIWALYFYTIDTGNFSGPGKIGRATAVSLSAPSQLIPNPSFSPAQKAVGTKMQSSIQTLSKSRMAMRCISTAIWEIQKQPRTGLLG